MHYFEFGTNKNYMNNLKASSKSPRSWRAAAPLLAWALVTIFAPGHCLADKSQISSFSALLEGKESDIVEAVEYVANDTVIHGTYVYDRETH